MDLRTRVVQLAAREEIFQLIAQGALKARAGRLAPESSMQVGRFNMMVVEDENGEGCAVQFIESRKMVEELALEKARCLDKRAEEWSEHEQRVWGRIYTSANTSACAWGRERTSPSRCR